MRKISALLLACLLVFSVFPAFAEDTVTPRVAALSGPTAMGMAAFLTSDDVYAAADELVPLFSRGEIDIASVPLNLIANLYNNPDMKDENRPLLLAVNTLGVLYIVEKGGDTISSIESLRGQTMYATGQGNTPEYALDYLLTQHGLTPDTDVTVEFKSSPNEVLPLLKNAEHAIAMLPQPFVTVAASQVEGLRIALDLTAEWDTLENGSRLITSGVMVRKGFAEENPEAVAAFLDKLAESVAFVNAQPQEAAQLIEALGIVKAPIAQKAIPACNIVCISGEEMQSIVPGYLATLLDQNPASVRGKLPDEGFYWAHEAK